jgi:hypothetical protein
MKDASRGEHPQEKSREPDDEETREEAYAAVWRRLGRREPTGQGRQCRDDVDPLYQELMLEPPARQLRIIREPRFRSLSLLDRLLEKSHDEQLSHPELAAQLGILAVRLGSAFRSDRHEAFAALPRAFCLGANALRLDSQAAAADELLARGSVFLAQPLDRAFYCRTLGVLRWEQARTDEAQALLRHAVSLYMREGLEGEAALVKTLLGLVLLETGSSDAVPALTRGWSGIDRDAQPVVALRGGLALAASLAQRGEAEHGRNVLSETWRLYAALDDTREIHRVFWWEGRALGALGDEAAVDLLDSVRRELLAEENPAETALVSIDLAVVLAENDRAGEIEALVSDLKSAFPSTGVLSLATEGIRSLVDADAHREDELALRYAASVVEVTLRRAFRVRGMGIRPFSVV